MRIDDDRAPEWLDLSEDSRFFQELLDGTHRWRQRLVEELSFESSTHVRASSSLQFEFPPDLIHKYVRDLDRTRELHVLLPLATRPKQALLNFGLIGNAGCPAHLLSRSSIAELQRDYLMRLAARSSAAEYFTRAGMQEWLEAICGFTPDVWRSFSSLHATRIEAMHAYLSEGLTGRLPRDLQVAEVGRWEARSLEIGQLIWEAAGDNERDELSSAHDVLLALPLVASLPSDPDAIEDLLAHVHSAVSAAAAGAAKGKQNDFLFLAQIAEYGARYELIVETTVPVLEPATLKITEDRPIRRKRLGDIDLPLGRLEQPFAINDAKSVHLEARCQDPNVRFQKRFEVRDRTGNNVGLGVLQSARITSESFSLYSSHPQRPTEAVVTLGLRLASHIYVFAAVLVGLNVAAGLMAAGVSGGGATLDRLAILAVPTTIAAAFALTREQTSLASLLVVWPRRLLVLSTIGLWVVVIWQIATYHPPHDHTGAQVIDVSGRSLH